MDHDISEFLAVLDRYHRGIDYQDKDLFLSAFCSDGSVSAPMMGSRVYRGKGAGSESLIAFFDTFWSKDFAPYHGGIHRIDVSGTKVHQHGDLVELSYPLDFLMPGVSPETAQPDNVYRSSSSDLLKHVGSEWLIQRKTVGGQRED